MCWRTPRWRCFPRRSKTLLIDAYHLLVLLKRRDLSEDLLKAMYRLEQVSNNHGLKLALVRHPNTSGPLLAALLPHLYLFELLNVCYLPGVPPTRSWQLSGPSFSGFPSRRSETS